MRRRSLFALSKTETKTRFWLLRTLLFAALACGATWPLPLHLATHYPLGSEGAATVPFASAWALWWTEDRALHGFADYWAAPIFYPVRDAFALSEPIPLLGLLSTPLLLLHAPVALAYNLVLLFSLTVNGLAAYALLRARRVSELGALVGGSCVCVMPAVYHQLGVLTLVPLAGMLGTLHFALRLVHVPRLRDGVGLGCAVAVAYACCAQYTLLVCVALAPALLIALGRKLFTRVRLGACAIAACIALGLIAPIALAQRQAVRAHGLVRSEQRAHDGSAALRSYIRSPPALLPAPPGVSVDHASRTALYPGGLRFLLACAGLYFGLRKRPRSRTQLFVAAFIVASAVLSMSGRIGSGDFSLHRMLGTVIPGLAQVRSVWRAGVATQLALTLSAAWGVERAWVWLARRPARLRLPLAAAGVLLALLEVWPVPGRLSPAPDERAHAAWASYMRRALAPGEPYCILPFVERDGVGDFEPYARLMVLTALHGRPMLNGYSSFFPEPHEQLWRAKLRFGNAKTAALLHKFGVRHVLTFGPARSLAGWPLDFEDARLALRVYRLPD